MSIRLRLLLTLAPLVVLLALLGAAGIGLLFRVGNDIDAILRENYNSVRYMTDLNEALERIDSSFNYDMLGQDARARTDYERNWLDYQANLNREANNITIPGEGDLVNQLIDLTQQYQKLGDRFFGAPRAERAAIYLGRQQTPGLLDLFDEIKRVAKAIRDLNQDTMVDASERARRTAMLGRYWLAGGLLLATLLAAGFGWGTLHAILGPLQIVTESADAIGTGNLSQVVPTAGPAELSRLARAFNRMSGQLRDYRQSASARLLRAQRTSQATIDAFPDPVLVLDPGGRVEMANPAARAVLGVAPPRDDETAIPWVPPEALRGPVESALQRQRPFVTQAFDQTLSFRLAGEERAYLPQALPIADPYGNTLGAAVVLTDVTRFRLMDQIKTDLVATVSHELKTPLTSVRLALHLLLEEQVGPLNAKQIELLIDARDSAERLLNMIEHLLALARLEEGREALDMQITEARTLLESAAELARPRARDKHLNLDVEVEPDLPPVSADPVRLGYALNNLIDNALAYTESGGSIRLAAKRVGEGVELSVTDTGVGIPAEHLVHIFDKFFRVPGQARGQGTGLGLAIVYEIVTAHHGRVTAESHPREGTVFRITLPVG